MYRLVERSILTKLVDKLSPIIKLFILIIYNLPVIVYLFTLIILCGSMISIVFLSIADMNMIYEELGNNLSISLFADQFLPPMILIIVVSMALMELTYLVCDKYLAAFIDSLYYTLKFKNYNIYDSTKINTEVHLKNEIRYMKKVIIFSIIFILMHVFYVLFRPGIEESIAFSVLIIGCLFGSAAILFVISYWDRKNS